MPTSQTLANGNGLQSTHIAGAVGILTRTVVRSPVVKHILHARIRHEHLNDVAFIGDDYVQIKQIYDRGHLEPIAIKDDFDGRIRAASVFSVRKDSTEVDFLIKHDPEMINGTWGAPPQLLVLALDTNKLLFVYLSKNAMGTFIFKSAQIILPRFDRTLFQLGEHVAVDPFSRAIAVAANEQELVIFAAAPSEQLQRDLRANDPNWTPVSQERHIQITGIIQHMAFLHPPESDEQHVILLLIVVDSRKTKATWIDWHYSTGLDSAVKRDGQTLSSRKTVANLLIPLKNANFLLVTGSEMELWKNLLTGSASAELLQSSTTPTLQPGSSPRQPLWTSWCRPLRNATSTPDHEHFYLVREDGVMLLLDVMASGVALSDAGDFGCNVGRAFASLGDNTLSPDVLAVAGEMCDGCVVSIGAWPGERRLSGSNRQDTMDMRLIETIRNWAPATDLLVSQLPRSQSRSMRSRDSIFITSGRQPQGSVTELRVGLEASLGPYLNLDDRQGFTGVWTLPLLKDGAILGLFSSPTSTRLLKFSAEMDESEELGTEEASAFVLDSHTLLAGFTHSGHLVQITVTEVRATVDIMDNFEDTFKYRPPDGSRITAATIEVGSGRFIIAEHDKDGANLVCFRCAAESNEHVMGRRYRVSKEVLSIAIVSADQDSLVCTVLVEGNLYLLVGAADDSLLLVDEVSLSTIAGDNTIYDNAIILQPLGQGAENSHRSLIVMGARDGQLLSMEISTADVRPAFGDIAVRDFAQSAVKLFQPLGTSNEGFAASGSDCCHLAWDGKGANGLRIESVCVTDKLRPYLAQAPIDCVARIPSADLLKEPDYADSLVLVSRDDFLVCTLAATPTTLPRQIAVSGSPTRLIYAEKQRAIVCASVRTKVRTFPSSLPHSRPEERRQIYPVIDFVPSRGSASSHTYDMQPGEKVYALLEWTYKNADDKVFAYVLVGGSYTKSNGSVRGKILLLQPTNRNWEVESVDERRTETFKEGPVYALALYDAMTYVICAGQSIMLRRFGPESSRWTPPCEPFLLSSIGTAVSVHDGIVSITTQRDSLVQLVLVERGRRQPDEPAFALKPANVAPRAANTLSHLIVRREADAINGAQPLNPTSNSPIPSGKETIILVSTTDRQLIGMTSPSANNINPETPSPHSTSARILFTADLPRSLTRLGRANTRPRWKPAPTSTSGVLADNIIGTSADGAVTGISLLAAPLWRQLFWLQCLCEWSSVLSPHSFVKPRYIPAEIYSEDDRNERSLPIGLSSGAATYISGPASASATISTTNAPLDRQQQQVFLGKATPQQQPEADFHINGDVLARLFARGGNSGNSGSRSGGEDGVDEPVELVKSLVRQAAERQDAVGAWVRAHLDAELQAAEALVPELRVLLDCWF